MLIGTDTWGDVRGLAPKPKVDASRLSRPLVLRGSYRLAGPGLSSLRPADGGHLLGSEGEPLVIKIAAEEVTILRPP